ncbi:hypothetical protein A2U01_0093816, partial [Trifolium medium]|nr:hypothetical protein [Trifolium medium]
MLSVEDNHVLVRPFLLGEIEEAVADLD